MTEQQRDERLLLLQAALDGELDAAGTMDIEAQVAADPALAAFRARRVALSEAIRALPRPVAPAALRTRIVAMSHAPVGRATTPFRWAPRVAAYRGLAASLALGIALGAGGYGMFAPPASPEDEVQRALVAGFVRGRLSGQPVDVATSDRHTVKPWLAGKIPTGTTVVDLKSDGFPLVGGRIDVVGATPVATLVYQRREHQVALSESPAPAGGGAPAPRSAARDGYSLLEWTDGGRRFTAVSDLPPGELDTFGADFRRAAAAEREETPKP